MHGLDAPQKDPSGTVTMVIGIFAGLYILAIVLYNIWTAIK